MTEHTSKMTRKKSRHGSRHQRETRRKLSHTGYDLFLIMLHYKSVRSTIVRHYLSRIIKVRIIRPSKNMNSMFPKPLKKDRPGMKRRRNIENEWERIRDERKIELEQDGRWICFYCGLPIWTWGECVIAHIQPKGRRPDLKLEKENLQCSHAHCNLTSDPHYNPHRL